MPATPRPIGTMGQLPPGEVLLVETVDGCGHGRRCGIRSVWPIVTQTTLSRLMTRRISWPPCKRAFPEDHRPPQGRHLLRDHQPAGGREGHGAADCDALLVVGAPNSSNSKRLVEVGAPCRLFRYAQLVQRADDIDWRALWTASRTLGITAGASAPEVLVERGDRRVPRPAIDVTVETRRRPRRKTWNSRCRGC